MMYTAQRRFYSGLFWSLLIVLIVALTWANWVYARANPLNSPFLAQYAGVRGLVTGGSSPYDPSSWQIARLLSTGQSEAPILFSQPFYIVFILLPVALIPDLAVARSLWMLILEISLAGSLLLLLNLRQWRPGRLSFILLVGFIFLGLHSVQALTSGSTAILAGLFFLITLVSLRKGWDEIAGVALVMATIQPEAMLPAVVFVLFWGITTRRGRLLLWFLGSLLLLSLLAMFFLPGWIGEYVRVLFNNWGNMPGSQISDLFQNWFPGIGVQFSWALRAAAFILLVIEWLSARRKDFEWFLWTAGLTISLTPWLGLPVMLENLVLLAFPVFLFQSVWDERIGHKDHWLPLVMMGVFWFGLWGLAFPSLIAGDSLSPGFLLPLPLLCLVSLYWVRWWYIRPLRLYQESLKKHEALR